MRRDPSVRACNRDAYERVPTTLTPDRASAGRELEVKLEEQ